MYQTPVHKRIVSAHDKMRLRIEQTMENGFVCAIPVRNLNECVVININGNKSREEASYV